MSTSGTLEKVKPVKVTDEFDFTYFSDSQVGVYLYFQIKIIILKT